MHPEKYTLTWHSYPDYLQEMMREMMTSEEFTDVTLVTDDKKTIRAHRNILSACSLVFKNILQMQITKSHPVIYLRDIQYSEIESILQFIYLGEAKVFKERMNNFLSVAKNLEIRELSQHGPSNYHQEDITTTVHVDHYNITKEEEVTTIESEPTSEKEVISREITSVGSKFQCPQCDKLFSQSRGVHAHIRSVHEGVKYACNQCDYQATEKGALKKHIQSKHEGIKYACKQCNYQASSQSNLTMHKYALHEGLKYACNECDYQAGFRSDLARHFKRKHL